MILRLPLSIKFSTTTHSGKHISIPALAYLSILDQLGKSIKPKNNEVLNNSPIINALQYFSDLNSKERKAIYALRNAFAHDFGLVNKNRRDGEMQHRFTVTQRRNTSKVVKLPNKYWDGDFSNKSLDSVTFIYLDNLGDLVESIIKEIIIQNEDDKIEVALGGGIEELESRYFLFIYNDNRGATE